MLQMHKEVLMHKLRSLTTFVALTFLAVAAAAQGNNPLITVNEHGVGSLLFPGVPAVNTTGIMAVDPGPGGLPSALTYNLLGPPSLIAGDLLIQELIGSTLVLSDVIRFNPAGTGSVSYPASLVFYSDNLDGVDAIADTGLPLVHYTNTFLMVEAGPEGNNGVFYTPTANQPGFVAGFSVTYHIVSDDTAVPEPASLSMVALALAAVAAKLRRAA
jgi:hypothetical protein